MEQLRFSSSELQEYTRDGYLMARGLFDPEEIGLMRRCAESELETEQVMVKHDREGNAVRLKIWDRPRDDIYGMFSRNERVVRNSEALLREPVYLYSAKMIMKNALDGGAWEWHQDYGYWYNYGCLFPTMLSCLIAVDRATRENGCLQVLKGSHRTGRLNHDRINEQTVADPERVQAMRDRFELVFLELEPGDAVFFDCNILHRSDANKSEHRRWNYIASYNAVGNQPYKQARDYGNYEPLTIVPGDAIRAFAKTIGL